MPLYHLFLITDLPRVIGDNRPHRANAATDAVAFAFRQVRRHSKDSGRAMAAGVRDYQNRFSPSPR